MVKRIIAIGILASIALLLMLMLSSCASTTPRYFDKEPIGPYHILDGGINC